MTDNRSQPSCARPDIEWLAKEIAEKASAMMTGQASYLQHIVKCSGMILDRHASLKARVEELEAALRAIYAVNTGNGAVGAIIEMQQIARAALSQSSGGARTKQERGK